MNYTEYTPEEFAADESFQDWVLRNNGHPFWEKWMAAHPEKKETIAEATRLLLHLQFSEQALPQGAAERSWHRLEKRLDQLPANNTRVRPKVRSLAGWQQMAAAVAAIILVAAGYFLLVREKTITHQTLYAQLRTLTLPDGSTVTLNGNTSIRYQENWDQDSPREVWLEGEAFFNVKKHLSYGNSPGAKFIVHASQMDVQVLGTSFNVSDRRGKTKVVLNSGKVQLDSHADKQQSPTLMQPGELALFSDQQQKIVKQTVNPENYSSWIHKKLIFDNTTIREVALLLEETYGIQVIVPNAALLDQKVSGSIPNDNIQVLIQALSRSLELPVHYRDNQLILGNPK